MDTRVSWYCSVIGVFDKLSEARAAMKKQGKGRMCSITARNHRCGCDWPVICRAGLNRGPRCRGWRKKKRAVSPLVQPLSCCNQTTIAFL